jgi:hypothetical protein
MVAHPREKVRAHRLRPLTAPQRVQVEAGATGAPRAVRFEGTLRPVAAVQDRWRIDDEWWRERPVSRLYYQLQLEGSRVITVYHDLIEGGWWLQRY